MNREVYGLLIGALTLLSLLLPSELFILVVSLLSTLIARELSMSLNTTGLHLASFLSPVAFYIDPSLGGVFTLFLGLSYGYLRWELDKFFRATFILFYTGFLSSYLVRLREEGITPLLILVLIVWTNDVVAYYFGKRFGKTPFLPKLSPNKTLEGFVAGLTAGSLLFVFISGIPLLEAVLIAFLTLLAGVGGDYLKSFIKRQLGIKDFSSILGGHGGFTDRFDALLMSAPVFYWLMFRI